MIVHNVAMHVSDIGLLDLPQRTPHFENIRTHDRRRKLRLADPFILYGKKRGPVKRRLFPELRLRDKRKLIGLVTVGPNLFYQRIYVGCFPRAQTAAEQQTVGR